MIRYGLFEKEITSGNHIETHFCLDKFADHFHSKSKQYILEQQLSNIQIDLSKYQYECTITSANTTSVGNYFHISYIGDPEYPYKFLNREILDYFKINVDFPVIYFTRKIPYEENFKCGFSLKTYKSLKCKFFDESIRVVSLFDDLYYRVGFAGDFTHTGNFIDKTINIEIMPFQTKKCFYSIKKVLLENFDVKEEKIDLYDKKFTNYTTDKFFFYIKIKLTENGTIVKLYRTYLTNSLQEQYSRAMSIRTLEFLR